VREIFAASRKLMMRVLRKSLAWANGLRRTISRPATLDARALFSAWKIKSNTLKVKVLPDMGQISWPNPPGSLAVFASVLNIPSLSSFVIFTFEGLRGAP